MKVIPAVLFQKQLSGVKEDAQKPERLALFGRDVELEEALVGAKLDVSQVRHLDGIAEATEVA